MPTFQLTSPHMKGDHVEALQRALKKDGYLQGNVDGEFGRETARAVYRAKYWLGYRKPDQVAGDALYGYLTGKRKPTTDMNTRRIRRIKAAKLTPVRMKMWKEARKHLGVKEHPAGSNICQFSLWYGIRGPWCAMFASYCGVAVGCKSFRRGANYAYVPNIVADARAGRNNLAVTYQPKQGDLVCFDWTHDGTADHVGLFTKWLSGGNFETIEGNTGVGNDSNGGEVMVRQRNKSLVQVFVHVGRPG